MPVEVECAEISNEFQDTLESNSQAIPSAVTNDNIQENVQILLKCEEGDNTIGQYSSSISLVPSILRDHCQEFFNPRVVSIGPLHHEDENLKGSEGWKRTCMRDLLDRLSCSPPEKTLASCMQKVNESIQKIRRCYVGMRRYTDHELARMMVIDACFILQFVSVQRELNVVLWSQICRDLLLVENQIPFFVLKDIFECTILKCNLSASLIDDLESLLQVGHSLLFKEDIRIPKDLAHTTHHSDHILSLFHKCYQPEVAMISAYHSLIYNVVELEKAGVSFKPSQDASEPNQDVSWPLAIKIEWSRFAWFSWFWVKPTLRIPAMIIQDESETLLRNIIAYEQTAFEAQYFTSYMAAIDDLVDSSHDIVGFIFSP